MDRMPLMHVERDGEEEEEEEEEGTKRRFLERVLKSHGEVGA